MSKSEFSDKKVWIIKNIAYLCTQLIRESTYWESESQLFKEDINSIGIGVFIALSLESRY